MKLPLFLLTLVLSINVFGQCTKCNSFDEALRKPEAVKSIIINSYMHGITLDSVPSFIEKFTGLEGLYLTDQNISAIPAEVGKLTKLKELSFGGCQLTEVPDFIFELKNLKELILFSNPFSEEYKEALKKKCAEKLPNTVLMIE
jgi:Leucine-rich repeat (LRR) protein